MVTKKSDEKAKGDVKSKSSVFGFVKSMADKLDPDLGMVENTNSKGTNSNNDTKETAFKKEPKTEKESESKSQDKVQGASTVKAESKSSKDDDSFVDNIKLNFQKLSDFIQEDRERITKILGIIVGGLFILSGIILLLGSSEKVVDNVIFGERSVTSAFLIIIGVLVIAGAFAQSIIKRTSFENIYKEVKVAEEDSSKSDKDSSHEKENKEKVNIQNSDSSKK